MHERGKLISVNGRFLTLLLARGGWGGTLHRGGGSGHSAEAVGGVVRREEQSQNWSTLPIFTIFCTITQPVR